MNYETQTKVVFMYVCNHKLMFWERSCKIYLQSHLRKQEMFPQKCFPNFYTSAVLLLFVFVAICCCNCSQPQNCLKNTDLN